MSSRLLFPDLALLLTLGCAARRPVLCPNAHLKSVGTAVAEQEVNDCIRLAETSGAANGKGLGVAKETAEGAVVGSAAGAGWGLVRGDVAERAAAGALAGAAATAARGAIRSGEPERLHRNFVQQFSWERGFQVIGWNRAASPPYRSDLMTPAVR